MTTLTAQQIACVYAWLAQLFSRELDDEQLTQIASAQMAEWFSLLKSEPPPPPAGGGAGGWGGGRATTR
ncbi:putative chaperone protein TorD [Escherichia coli MS 175-1]|nr:putative chaperone protein TorD [Escherichia coli MS 175-1]